MITKEGKLEIRWKNRIGEKKTHKLNVGTSNNKFIEKLHFSTIEDAYDAACSHRFFLATSCGTGESGENGKIKAGLACLEKEVLTIG